MKLNIPLDEQPDLTKDYNDVLERKLSEYKPYYVGENRANTSHNVMSKKRMSN